MQTIAMICIRPETLEGGDTQTFPRDRGGQVLYYCAAIGLFIHKNNSKNNC